jgi:FAD/FMN-containing dehydrogenase
LEEYTMAALVENTTATIPESTVHSLAEQLRGEIIRPGDTNYDQARQVWNATIDRRPALIVRPRDADDVITSVGFARANDLPLAVRSGGHSAAGFGTVEGGVALDLSLMKRFALDPARRVATAETGLTWGEFNGLAAETGLATPGPDVGAVGLGGHTLGGGFGWLSRRHGMTIDNLLAAEVVTADGNIVNASAEEHPDLFWALRGGGGNFGIATRFTYRLHPVETVIGGAIAYPASRAVLRDYVKAAAAAPDELATITFTMLAPPAPFIPTEAHGMPIFLLIGCYVGEPGGAERAFAPLRKLGGGAPLADTVVRLPYPALFQMTKMGETRRPQAIRAGFMTSIDDVVLDAIVDAVGNATSPFGSVMLRVLGGAITRVATDATAFSHRDKPFYMVVSNAWDNPRDSRADHHVTWTEALWRVLSPRTTGAYANYLGNEGPERILAAYSPAAFARLAKIKRRYDPDNVFRLNANILPS